MNLDYFNLEREVVEMKSLEIFGIVDLGNGFADTIEYVSDTFEKKFTCIFTPYEDNTFYKITVELNGVENYIVKLQRLVNLINNNINICLYGSVSIRITDDEISRTFEISGDHDIDIEEELR